MTRAYPLPIVYQLKKYDTNYITFHILVVVDKAEEEEEGEQE